MPPTDATPFDEGPVGTEEVHTEILSLNMVGGGAAVRAGTPTYGHLKRLPLQ